MFLRRKKSLVYLWMTLWTVMRLPPGGTLQPSTNSGVDRKYKVVCYHTNWSQYRQKPARFYPYNIDPTICTHIIYSFAKIDYRGQLAPLEWNDIDYPHMYRQFTNLKKKNPKLRTLLAVGGWNHGSAPFTTMVKSKESRRYFIDHTVQYLRSHKFDGLDLDWEYPANRGSPAEDKNRFVDLVRELREAFEDEAIEKKHERLLLSAAVGCGFKIIDSAYDVKRLASYFDFINLMTYDFHGSWEKKLGIHAALYPRKEELGTAAGKLTVDWAVKRFMELGAPSEKLIMGIPLYGRSFELCGSEVKPGSKACGGGRRGPFTKEKGFLAYYEIVRSFQDGWVREWDNEHMAPYAYSTQEKQWVGYDDMESIYHKAMYVKSHKLGGAMVWALDLDDFSNIATEGMNYPLMRTINDVLWDDFLLPHNPIPEQISTIDTIVKLNHSLTLPTTQRTTWKKSTTNRIPTKVSTSTRTTASTPKTTLSTEKPHSRVTSRRNPYTPPKPRKTRKPYRYTTTTKQTTIRTTPRPRRTTKSYKRVTVTPTTRPTQRSRTTRAPARLTTRRKVTPSVTRTQTQKRTTVSGLPKTTEDVIIRVSEGGWNKSTEKSSRIRDKTISPVAIAKTSQRTAKPTRPTTRKILPSLRDTTTKKRRTITVTTSRPSTPRTTRTTTMPSTKSTTLEPFTTAQLILPTTWNWWYKARTSKRIYRLTTRYAPTTTTTVPPTTTTVLPTTIRTTQKRPTTTTSRPQTSKRKTTSATPSSTEGGRTSRVTLGRHGYKNKTLNYKIQNSNDQKDNTTTPCIIIQVQEKVEKSPIFERIRPPKRPPMFTTKTPFVPRDKTSDFVCPTIFGIYADPQDCVSFYQCVWFVPFHYSCGPGTAWNDPLKVCDWPERVNCVVL